MEFQNVNSIRMEYISFKDRLDINILNYPTNNNSEDCYLVEQSFIK